MKKNKQKKPQVKKKPVAVALLYKNGRIVDSYDTLSLLNFEIYASSHCCLLPGTQILMSNKTTKKVEDIQSGDTVQAVDITTMEITIGTVKELLKYTNNAEGYYVINNSLKVTGKHPLWIKGKGWVAAKDINKGDTIFLSNGEFSEVSSVILKENNGTVYDISIKEEVHNYFAEGILVHNKTHI